jgi:hypothetical protein
LLPTISILTHIISNIPLKVLNINFQSIKRKQHIVNNIIESSKPDIVVGTETWLKPNIHTNEVFPEKYDVYRKDRIDQEGGGFLLAIKKEFISDEVNDRRHTFQERLRLYGCWVLTRCQCLLQYLVLNFRYDVINKMLLPFNGLEVYIKNSEWKI